MLNLNSQIREDCDEKEAWLQLSDYSNKYRVSVSTLRRRIKAGEIQYQFEDGKYWLPDRAIEKVCQEPPGCTASKAPEPSNGRNSSSISDR